MHAQGDIHYNDGCLNRLQVLDVGGNRITSWRLVANVICRLYTKIHEVSPGYANQPDTRISPKLTNNMICLLPSV